MRERLSDRFVHNVPEREERGERECVCQKMGERSEGMTGWKRQTKRWRDNSKWKILGRVREETETDIQQHMQTDRERHTDKSRCSERKTE